MTRRSILALATVGVAVVVATGCAGSSTNPPHSDAAPPGPRSQAVVPTYHAANRTFEGFPVISYLPSNPAGVVFLFHGSGGSADFATKLETVDMLNHLSAAGYGFVSTESTDRTDKQWDTASLSLSANPDLARLARLYASMKASGAISDRTPIYAVGFSRGAGFASVFGQAFEDARYPMGAIAASHGQIAGCVRAAGGLTVPAFFTLGANDPFVDNRHVVAQVEEVAARGVPAISTIEPESSLRASRFRRVPGVDGATATAIFSVLVKAGLWNATGDRLVDISTVQARLPTLSYPAKVTADQKQLLRDQINVLLAVHEYSATYASQTVEFFNAHVG